MYVCYKHYVCKKKYLLNSNMKFHTSDNITRDKYHKFKLSIRLIFFYRKT